MRDALNQIKKQMAEELDFSNAETIEMAEMLDSLDAEDFEQMDNAEYAEYLEFLDNLEDAEHKHGLRHGKTGHRKAHGHKKVKRHVKPLKGRAKLAAIGGGGSYAPNKPGGVSNKAPVFGSAAFVQETMTSSVGDLNITITRETAALAGIKLPLILFGLNGLTSNFISTLKAYMPAGITMTAADDPATGDMLYSYTDAVNTDIIRVSLTGSQISYSEFLQSMNQNYFKTRYIRQEYPNDANLLTGVSQMINFGLLSALGMKNANGMLPRSRRLSSDYQTFIINLFMPEQNITADFSFVQNVPAVAGYITAWDIFMSSRKNLNNM